MGHEVDRSEHAAWGDRGAALLVAEAAVEVIEFTSVHTSTRDRATEHLRLAAAERVRHAELRHAQLDQWQAELELQRREIEQMYRELEVRAVEIARRQSDLEVQHETLAIRKREVVRREAECTHATALLGSCDGRDRSTLENPFAEPIHRIEQEAANRRASERLRLADLRHEQLGQWQDRLEMQQHILAEAHRELAEQRRRIDAWHSELEATRKRGGAEPAAERVDDPVHRSGPPRDDFALSAHSPAGGVRRARRRRRPCPAEARARLLQPRRRRR